MTDGPGRRRAPPPPSALEAARREAEHHIAERTDRLVERGWTLEAARAEAERRFGDREAVERALARRAPGGRGPGRGSPAGDLVQDVRWALRQLRRAPVFAVAVVATLALGIGANVAIFSMVDAVLLRPLPVRSPEDLVAVYQALSNRSPRGGAAYPVYLRYREAARSLSGLAAHATLSVGLRAGEVTDRVEAGLVSGNYFGVLGVGATVGRTLLPSDETGPGEKAVVVLSHDLWMRAFGGDPDVVGRTVEVTGTTFEVVGVAAEGFQGTDLSSHLELWVPVTMVREVAGGGLYRAPNVLETPVFAWLGMVGRLSPETTLAAARAELNVVAARLRAEEGTGIPDVEEPVSLLPLETAATLGDRDRLLRFVGLLLAVVGLTLVVACANVANLLLARARARRRELGVRRAVGAGTARLVRQLFTEGLVLSLLGGGVGVLVAAGTARLLRTFTLPGDIPLDRLRPGTDGVVLAAAVGLSALTALVFSTGPALMLRREDPARRLRSGGRTRTGGRRHPGDVLVSLQVGLSVLLLVGALLFLRSLRAGLSTDPGFPAHGLAALSVGLRARGYEGDEAGRAADRILREAEASPDVASAAMAVHVPLAPPRLHLPVAPEEGWGDRDPSPLALNVVTPGFFETLGLRLLEGRTFDRDDGADTDEVVVVNRAAAELLWPDGPAPGRRLRLVPGLSDATLRVVGVVADAMAHSVTDRHVPYVYALASQNPDLGFAERAELVARARSDASSALVALRGAVRDIDPALVTFDARRVEDQLDRVLMPQRFGATLLGILALITLLVAATGVYGVVAYRVGRRQREIGIRMALGARPGRVVRLVVGTSLAAVAVGGAAGLLAAGFAMRLLSGYLLRVGPLDPLSFGGALALLGGAAALAALLPARRAARTDPRRTMDPDRAER